MHKHFQGQTTDQHLSEKKDLFSYLKESHIGELSGIQLNFSDSLRETTFVLTLFVLVSSFISISLPVFLLFSLSLIIWRSAKTAWLGWSYIEKLHRIIEEERYEIEHHPDQEKEELITLYKHKGFEGPLLNQIVDHYMSDFDRLLRVMLEEEMGLSLSRLEHPLKQAFGAFLGALTASLPLFLALLFSPVAFYVLAALLLALSAFLPAYLQKNHITSALVWTLAIASLALGASFFILKIVF